MSNRLTKLKKPLLSACFILAVCSLAFVGCAEENPSPSPFPCLTVKYAAAEGGRIYGDMIQTVRRGGGASTVAACAFNGYRFKCWSDGVTEVERKDGDITENAETTAQFEKIYVEFYSDGYMIRKVAVGELNSYESDSLKAYKSFSKFTGWALDGWVKDIAPHYNGDALELLKTQYNAFGIRDVADIRVKAVFDSVEDGSAIGNSITIAHALGGLDGGSYLNSKEALETNYNNGQRFFEADIGLTADGRIVAKHGGCASYSYDEFMSSATDGYTPLSLESIIDFMVLHPDIAVDFDTLSLCADTGDNYERCCDVFKSATENCDSEIFDRIIMEITPWNLRIKQMMEQNVGIKNFLYTEDNRWWSKDLEEFESACRFCQDNGIRFASLPCDAFNRYGKERVELLKKYGIKILAYTSNDISEMYTLYDLGVDCVFTDFILI